MDSIQLVVDGKVLREAVDAASAKHPVQHHGCRPQALIVSLNPPFLSHSIDVERAQLDWDALTITSRDGSYLDPSPVGIRFEFTYGELGAAFLDYEDGVSDQYEIDSFFCRSTLAPNEILIHAICPTGEHEYDEDA